MNTTATAPVVTSTDVTPGTIVHAQLGNPGDSSWCPRAEIVVLGRTDAILVTAYYAVAKKEDGSVLFLLDTTFKRSTTAKSREVSGEMYSTAALSAKQLDRYLGVVTANKLRALFAEYSAEFSKLTAYTNISK